MKKSLFLCALLCSLLLAACASGNKSNSDEQKKAALYYQHGTEKLINKDYTEALKYLLQAEKLNSTDPEIHNNLGMAYYFKKQNTKAIFHLKKAIQLDDKNSDARNNLAGIYLEMGQNDLAESEYQKVLDDLIYKTQYTTYYNLALIRLKQNRTSEAIAYLQKAIENNADYCAAYYLLGNIWKKEYSFKNALDMFRRGAKGTCSNLPAPLYEQAMIQIEMGETQAALEKLKEIIARFPGTAFDSLAKKKLQTFPKTNDNQQYKVMTEQKDFATPSF